MNRRQAELLRSATSVRLIGYLVQNRAAASLTIIGRGVFRAVSVVGTSVLGRTARHALGIAARKRCAVGLLFSQSSRPAAASGYYFALMLRVIGTFSTSLREMIMPLIISPNF
jgi:hypothetical protein